jgi:hypothetical protein
MGRQKADSIQQSDLMLSVTKSPLPSNALLSTYSQGNGYTDCYRTELRGSYTLPQYIFAFYTTAIFKLERLILKLAASKPSNDDQANSLAEGNTDVFAAWSVEQRTENQILLADYIGRTRSWLMIEPSISESTTTLYFGSAIVPTVNPKSGQQELGTIFHALLGFHKLYSKILLAAAKSRLASR